MHGSDAGRLRIKKILRAVSLTVIAVLLTGGMPFSVSSGEPFPFSDVTEDDRYFESVRYECEKGIMICMLGFSYETINYINHGMWKRARISFPYTVEGINRFASLGIDANGVYYFYTSDDPYKDLSPSGFFFMNGYYAERGENPSIAARLH